MARRRATLEARSLIREAQAIVGGAIALFLALAVFSYSPDMPHHNLGGRIGNAIADAALQAIGVAAYLFPLYLALLMASLFRYGTEDLGMLRVAAALLLVASVAALAGVPTIRTRCPGPTTVRPIGRAPAVMMRQCTPTRSIV